MFFVFVGSLSFLKRFFGSARYCGGDFCGYTVYRMTV